MGLGNGEEKKEKNQFNSNAPKLTEKTEPEI